MNRRTRAGHDAQAGRLVRVVAYGLLLFVAVAIIHEFVPGLCAASDAQGDECPFCALIYTLVIAVAAFLCLLRASSVRANLASADTIAPP
ncbi:MAG: hypothetical protein JXR94_23855, partial [Candidatus Hydrogenedentes bacterium]|nr:hypothetical protein [Candidatus Hydrogenedentota bacterium]